MQTVYEQQSSLLMEERRLTSLRDYLLAHAGGDLYSSTLDAVEQRLNRVRAARHDMLHAPSDFCDCCGELVRVSPSTRRPETLLCRSCVLLKSYTGAEQERGEWTESPLGHGESATSPDPHTHAEPLLSLLLVRHGHTEWNETGRCLGRTDVPLSLRGRQAVAALGRHVDFSACSVSYCSPAQRAVETAQLLLNGAQTDVRIRENLREIDFGTWEGVPWRTIYNHRGEEWRSWNRDPTGQPPHSGESLDEVAARAFREYLEIRKHHEGESVLMIGHGGSLNALLCRLLGTPLSVRWRYRLRPASLSKVVVYPECPTLTLLNHSPGVARLGHRRSEDADQCLYGVEAKTDRTLLEPGRIDRNVAAAVYDV